MIVSLSWLEIAYSRPVFQQTTLTCKVSQTDASFCLIFGQTDTYADSILTSLYE